METSASPDKKCNFCGEVIAVDLSRCPYCGSLLHNDIGTLDIGKTETYQSIPYENNSKNNDCEDELPNNIEYTNEQQGCCVEDKKETSSESFDKKPDLSEEVPYNKEIIAGGGMKNTAQENIEKNTLGNGLKVFLTVISAVIPGLGQLFGLIAGILLMNSEDEKSGADKRSFGFSLIISSLIMFVVSGISWFILLLALAAPFK